MQPVIVVKVALLSFVVLCFKGQFITFLFRVSDIDVFTIALLFS